MNTTHTYKLFVDDMRPIPPGWIGARTVSEAIAVLACLPIKELSLDHDIIFPRTGADLYQSLSLETYRGIAYYVAQMPEDAKPKVWVHTANIGAGRTMCDIMKLKFEDTYRFYHPDNYK